MKNILYTKFFNQKIEENINLILSPQFYWIKKIEIPLNSLREAKKISQNYFKLDENYIFDAIKIENNYFAIAIDKKIDIKIDKKYIKSIKLAQTELYKYDEINIENNYKLKKIEDILFCFPENSNTAPFIDEILSNIKLSNHNFNLYNSIEIDKKNLILLSIIFIFSFLSLTTLIFSYKTEFQKLAIKKEKLKKYNLPLTNIQLDSILTQLEDIDFKNKMLKKDLKFIMKTPLKQNEYFMLLNTIQNGYKIIIKTDRNLNNYFKQRFNIKSFKLKNSIYKLEITNG